MKKTVRELVENANTEIVTLDANSALNKAMTGNAQLIDIRDIRELQRDGTVEKASHVPRGMLEFWFDAQSPYHKQWLADESKQYILYCASGWRSALSAKTLQDMGFDNIAHVDGGFGALKEAGATIAKKE